MTVNFQNYDCLDIGADTNSLQWARDYLGARRPLGLNIEDVRIQRMKEQGEDCINLDCFNIPDDVQFDYVIMSHFLEHLQSEQEVFRILEKAVNMARKGVYIAGPHFESDVYIRNFGFKYVWGDWDDHASRYSTYTFLPFLLNKFSSRITLSHGFRDTDSSDDCIVSIDERPNIMSYKNDAQQKKEHIIFPRPAYKEFLIFIDNTARRNLADITKVHLKRHGQTGTVLSKTTTAEQFFQFVRGLKRSRKKR